MSHLTIKNTTEMDYSVLINNIEYKIASGRSVDVATSDIYCTLIISEEYSFSLLGFLAAVVIAVPVCVLNCFSIKGFEDSITLPLCASFELSEGKNIINNKMENMTVLTYNNTLLPATLLKDKRHVQKAMKVYYLNVFSYLLFPLLLLISLAIVLAVRHLFTFSFVVLIIMLVPILYVLKSAKQIKQRISRD